MLSNLTIWHRGDAGPPGRGDFDLDICLSSTKTISPRAGWSSHNKTNLFVFSIMKVLIKVNLHLISSCFYFNSLVYDTCDSLQTDEKSSSNIGTDGSWNWMGKLLFLASFNPFCLQSYSFPEDLIPDWAAEVTIYHLPGMRETMTQHQMWGAECPALICLHRTE